MRKGLTFLTLLLVAVCLLLDGRLTSVSNATSGGEEFVAGEVVVKLASAADLPGVAVQYHLDPTPIDQFGSRPIYRLRITDNAAVEDRVKALSSDSRVVFVEPNFVATPPEGGGIIWSVGNIWSVGGDNGTFVSQWAAQKIQLSLAHQINRGTGPNGPIKVAVLDTGIDKSHPAFAGRLLPGWDFVDDDADVSEVGDPQTGPYGHGTHVAGLVALVAPEAKIIPIRVLDKYGVGNIWVLAEALAFAIDPDRSPATADGADVINLSLSTLRETKLIGNLLAEACGGSTSDDYPVSTNPHLVVVAAAGNAGNDTKQYPAAENVDGLMAVAASTSDDTLASFSTRASWIHVAAPGKGIVSTVPNSQYATWSGTSMAAPIVAGEAALVRATFPYLSNKDIVRHVQRMSVEIGGDVKYRIDAGIALTSLPEGEVSPTPTPTPTPTPSPSPSPTPKNRRGRS